LPASAPRGRRSSRSPAASSSSSRWGIEYVIFALVIGLAVGHVAGTATWLRDAARTELFIKTGLD